MNFLVTVTFDLHHATTDDYQNVYAGLRTIGLSPVLRSSSGNVVTLPATTCCGEFTGPTAEAVQGNVLASCENLLRRLGLGGKVFVVVGSDWAWGLNEVARPTPLARLRGLSSLG